nr:MAG TPA: hypothetical protein [Herelleviridae sp.]
MNKTTKENRKRLKKAMKDAKEHLTGEEEITQKNLIIDEAIEKEFKE